MGGKYDICVSIFDNLKRKEKEFVENIYGKTETYYKRIEIIFINI